MSLPLSGILDTLHRICEFAFLAAGACGWRSFSTRGRTCVSVPANASATSRKTQPHSHHPRRIFGNGSENCPSGTFHRFGRPRAAKPALAKPSRMASAVNATCRHLTSPYVDEPPSAETASSICGKRKRFGVDTQPRRTCRTMVHAFCVRHVTAFAWENQTASLPPKSIARSSSDKYGACSRTGAPTSLYSRSP